MDLGKSIMVLALAVIVLLFGLLFLAFLSTFSGTGPIGDQLAKTNPVNISYDLADCRLGDTGSFNTSSNVSMNLTVKGVISHKGRDACHSSGIISDGKDAYEIDIYRVAQDDECIGLLSLADPTNYGEKCYGYWPGYNPS